MQSCAELRGKQRFHRRRRKYRLAALDQARLLRISFLGQEIVNKFDLIRALGHKWKEEPRDLHRPMVCQRDAEPGECSTASFPFFMCSLAASIRPNSCR